MKQRNPIYIIGEGITEKYYFQHLKKNKAYSCKIRPRFFSKNTSIFYMQKQIKALLEAGVRVICVFDADVSERNEKEKERIRHFLQKYKNNQDVIVCDSMPSIEFWFLIHFQFRNKYFPHNKAIQRELRKYLKDYKKTEKYLKQEKWVKELISKQKNALENAKKIAPNASSYSMLYKAIEELEKNK